MENSEEGKTVLARITENENGYTVEYDSKKVVFNSYQRGVMNANVEYRSIETMEVLNKLYTDAVNYKGTPMEKSANAKLEQYLEEILNTMEILDIE